MVVGSGSRYTWDWADEVTYGVPPGGNYQRMRIVNDTVGRDTEAIESDEIDPDGQTANWIQAAAQLSGEFPVEFSFGAHEQWLRRGLRADGDFAGAVPSPAADKEFLPDTPVVGQTTIQLASGTWAGFVPNAHAFVKGPGVTSARNRGAWKIISTSGTDLVVEGTGIAEGPSANIDVQQNEQVVTGNTLYTMSGEGQYQNIPTVADRILQRIGFAIEGFSIECVKRDRVRGAFRVIGKDEVTPAASDAAGIDPISTGRVYSVTGDLRTFAVNGDRSARMTAFRINYSNGMQIIDPAGVLTPENLLIGTAAADGNFEYYYENPAIYALYESFTDLNFLLAFEDAAGQGLVFEILRASPTAGRRNPGGKNNPSQANIGWNAQKHGTELVTMKVSRTTT